MALGALLVAIGFFLYSAAPGNVNPNGFLQAFGILVGLGVLVAGIGWLMLKMIRSRTELGAPKPT